MDDGTKEMKAKLLNLIAKGKIARETQANIECCQSHDRGCLPCGIGVYQTGFYVPNELPSGLRVKYLDHARGHVRERCPDHPLEFEVPIF